jgi:hypothetical protein
MSALPNEGDRTEPASIETSELNAGDTLQGETGDYRGNGKWNFHNYSLPANFMVVEEGEDSVTLIHRGDRLAYNVSENLRPDLDTFTLNRDGTIEGYEGGVDATLAWKEVEVVEGLSGRHYVAEALAHREE